MGEQGFLDRHAPHSGLDRLTAGLVGVLAHAREADGIARRDGLLQGLDPRTKLGGLIALIAAAAMTRSVAALCGLLLLIATVAAASRIGPRRLWPLWVGVLGFTGLIAAPAMFLVPGPLILPGVSWPGLRSAAFLVLRAEVSTTLALATILTTPWPHLLKALRSLGIPLVVVMIAGMTERYIFALAETAVRTAEGRESRRVGRLDAAEKRRQAGAAAGMLFVRSLDLAEEVHQAMVSRGWRGEPALMVEFRFGSNDLAAALGVFAVVVVAVWAGLR